MADLDDAVTALAAAQRRLRRRALLIAAAGAALVAVGVGALWWGRRPAADPPPIARPYLWRVEGAHPSYLFGTLHIAYGVDDLPASVRAALARSTTVVVESDLLAPAAPGRAAAPAPVGGRDRLTDDEWTRLAQMTGQAEAALVARPSAQLLGAALASQTRRVEPMDRGVQARAVAARKAVVFLEDRDLTAVTDAAGQAVIDEPAVLEQVRMIVAHPQALRAALRRIVRDYASGGPRGCRADATAGFVEQLNDDWFARIEAAVRAGDAFVAIGCAHLEGDAGVLARLRDRGYAITRVER